MHFISPFFSWFFGEFEIWFTIWVSLKTEFGCIVHHVLKKAETGPWDLFAAAHDILEEVMDYRTYCETIAGLLRKPIVKLLRNLKNSRNVKWIYQEGISISGRCFLACFNGKLQ